MNIARLIPAVLLAAALAPAQTKPSPFPGRNPKPKTEAKTETKSETKTAAPPASGNLCRATFYGPAAEGAKTSSGEPIRNSELTLAHPSLAFQSEVELTNIANGKSLRARVNDRFAPGDACRINVTTQVARELGFLSAGSADLRVEPVK